MGERVASWFAILLMAVVLATSYWYARTLRSEPEPDAQRIGAIDSYADNIALTGFDALGRPHYRLFADRMTHFGNSDDVDLLKPNLLSMRQDQPRVQATALAAHASNNAETVEMHGNVVLTRAADERRASMRMTTDAMTVIPDEDRFSTADPVLLESGGNIVHAVGMDFDNIAHTVTLRTEVSGTFPPRSRP